MRDARRIEEREQSAVSVRLQVAAITGLGLAVLATVFGLGYMVGKRAAHVALAGAEAELQAADPLAKLDAERQAHDKLTFYSQLTKDGPKPSMPPAVPRAPDLVPVIPAVPEEPPAQVDNPPPPAQVPAAPARTPPKADKSAPAKRPTGAPHVVRGLASGPARSGEYTVQVSSFQTHAEAKAFSASLERQGFRPFVVQASLPNKGTWYRVRLGRFDDETQARQAKGILNKADIPGWVLRSE